MLKCETLNYDLIEIILANVSDSFWGSLDILASFRVRFKRSSNLRLAGGSPRFCREHRQGPCQPDRHPALLCQHAGPRRSGKVRHGHQGGGAERHCVGKGGSQSRMSSGSLEFRVDVYSSGDFCRRRNVFIFCFLK